MTFSPSPATPAPSAHEALPARIQALESALAAALDRIGRLEDLEAIKRLQRIYGYYVDKALWSQVIPLFTEDCEIEIAGRGIYRGHQGADTVLRVLVGGGQEGLVHGQLLNHMQLQGVVDLDESASQALGRWRAFIQVGRLDTTALWCEGVYNMRYVRVDGLWRIQGLHWFASYYTPFEGAGWKEPGLPLNGPSDVHPPDAPPSVRYGAHPDHFTPPFHYPNPVTGQRWET